VVGTWYLSLAANAANTWIRRIRCTLWGTDAVESGGEWGGSPERHRFALGFHFVGGLYEFFLKLFQSLLSRGILARPGFLNAVLGSQKFPAMVPLRDICGLSRRQPDNFVSDNAVLIGQKGGATADSRGRA
jgi:hypothetical protein